MDRFYRIFKRVEPYLTFLSIPQLERQGADIQSKVEELEQVNQSLRNRDTPKELEQVNQSLRNRDTPKDFLRKLSDQLVTLSTKLQEIERRQQLLT
jgi:hypothetical protein